MSILIVGASVAGIRTAQALRSQGCRESITILGAEKHHPYDKPPLSKDMLIPGGPKDPVPLLTDAELCALDVDLRLGCAAETLDVDQQTVTTERGQSHRYDTLVIATGAEPRIPRGAGEFDGIFTLRDADDAIALRPELSDGVRVVVIGGGFIGAEFASSAHANGAHVTIIDSQPTPLARLLGDDVGRELATLHTANGVVVRSGITSDHFRGHDRVSAVALSDGTVLRADLVLAGIGVRPSTDWLASSGLLIEDGVKCDSRLRAIGTTNIYAAGDVACNPHEPSGEHYRIEHWTNANEHAAMVAAAILDLPQPRAQVPYVWSDQYGHRIQIVGRPSIGRVALSHGSAVDGSLIVLYSDNDDLVVGGLTVDQPRVLMKMRKAIAHRTPADQLINSLRLPYVDAS